jgi:transposase
VTTDLCWEKPQSEARSEARSDDRAPAIEVTPDPDRSTAVQVCKPPSGSAISKNRTPSACEPYREIIELGLDRGRNAMAIWQDLVTGYGFQNSYQRVKRYVQKIRPSQVVQPRAVIVTDPGEEAQVDYGQGPMVRDPKTGNYRRTRLFVMTLGYSRKSVRLLVFKSSSRVWAELHETAFRRLGGSVRIIIYDYVPRNIIVEDRLRAATEPDQCVLVTFDQLLQFHRSRELHVHIPRVAQHHHECVDRDQPA